MEKLEQVAGLLKCPVCDKLLEEPVVYGVCLHVFCFACAKAPLGLLAVCPMCGEVTNGANVVPVPLIGKLVDVIKGVDNRNANAKRQRDDVPPPRPSDHVFVAKPKAKKRIEEKDGR